jgi:glycosyltransferase involved in cell wall biosynthesis
MTRVLIVYQPTDGGVGRHVADIAAGLADHGYEAVLCGPGPPEQLRHRDPPIRRLELQRAVAPRADLANLRAFMRIAGEVKPDIVHAHSSKAGAIARLGRLARPRTPVLYTPHGYSFAGHFTRRAERAAYRETERALAPFATRVLCVCEAEARLARQIGPAKRVRVLYNGVEPIEAGPADSRMLDLSRRGPVICAVTLLRPGKGLETLIDATPGVLRVHPNAQVAIVGDGPDLADLRARAHACGVAHSVHFLGSSADPIGMMRGASVFVHPSLAEAFPYAILEAMSLGLPVIASDVGGVGEALGKDGGLLVEPGDAPSLTRALLALLDDPHRASRMGGAARRRIEGRFTRTAMIDRLIGIYEEVRGRSCA